MASNDQHEDLRTVTLSGGVEMPTIAFGCAFGDWVGRRDFQGFLPEQAWRAMSLALDAGYRSFDGAHVYATEGILGALLGPRFASGALQREDLFLTTKLAHPPTPPEVNISHLRTFDPVEIADPAARVKADFARSIDELHVGYVDLLLMHWPGSFSNEDAKAARTARRHIWESFLELKAKGATRAIGVSNFTLRHLKELLEDLPGTAPAVNQIEVHPYCRDPELEAFCAAHDIRVTAYAPFASGAFDIFEDATLTKLADQHGTSVGQLILRWHLQSGRTVLPKSTNAQRMAQNLDLFSFTLSDEQVAAIDALAPKDPRRSCPDPAVIL